MNTGDACYIFKNIAFAYEYTDEEKLTAIKRVVDMETHNSITKADMLDVIKFLVTRMETNE